VSEGKEAARPAGARQYKPYPAYKDSGVEWLGEIPAHWEVRRADSFLRYDKIQIEPSEITQDFVFHYSIPAVQATGDGALEAPTEIDSAKLRVVSKRLLVSKLNPRKGVVLIASERDVPTICSTEFVPFEVRGCDLQWAMYLFLAESTRQRLSAVVRSATRSHQRAEVAEIVKIWHGVPSMPEQRTIAAFLDRETARIDALVAKKERLIALLQEQRTALITRAVTKGLDPTVTMKDSGVEWLGEIPAHWRAMALKRIGDLQAGAGFPDDEQGLLDEEVPFFKVGDMGMPGNEREMRVHQHSVSRATARRLGAFIFPPDTIVFAKVGAALLLNRRRLVVRPSCIDNNMMGFMPAHCDPTWAMYWLSGLDMGELANPGAVPSVNEGQMRDTPAAVPPEPEQRAIAAFLDRETAKIDALIAKVRAAIERLKEYRTALISAAVTGKIDVREEVV
jgi:type I restriction enzyme S subunit